MTTTEKYSEKIQRTAELAKALGHPARVAILLHLVKTKGCICGDLVDVLPIAQATVSQHLKELKRVGIIQGNIEGTSICYCIDPIVGKEAKALLGELFEAFKTCC